MEMKPGWQALNEMFWSHQTLGINQGLRTSPQQLLNNEIFIITSIAEPSKNENKKKI